MKSECFEFLSCRSPLSSVTWENTRLLASLEVCPPSVTGSAFPLNLLCVPSKSLLFSEPRARHGAELAGTLAVAEVSWGSQSQVLSLGTLAGQGGGGARERERLLIRAGLSGE